MKTSRYREARILSILRQAEGGVPVAELCREYGMMPLPGNGLFSNHERERDVLQTAGEVWRDGCVQGQPDDAFCGQVLDHLMVCRSGRVQEGNQHLAFMPGGIDALR